MAINKQQFDQLVTWFLAMPGAIEDQPFGADAFVYKVKGKMFGLIGTRNDQLLVNLKCNPDEALALRASYEGIIAGYHMNKKHWNSIKIPSDVPESLIQDLIQQSYQLVVKKLTKAQQVNLKLQP